jgi:hypothetical protein
VMALTLGFLIRWLWASRAVFRYLLVPVISFVLVLNLFQTWQYCNSILDPERMTEAYYWSIFGKTEVSDADRELLDPATH